MAGVLISGSDPSGWLEHASAWNVPAASLRFLPVHETRRQEQQTSSAPIGVLCFRASGEFPAVGAAVGAAVDALLYRLRADRLFLPIDADVAPAISDSDLLPLLAEDRRYVWHPSIGLVGYEPEDVLSVRDLLISPAVRTADWDAAEIGEQLNGTIRNLLPEPAPHVDDILDRGQDDIGSEASNLSDAPRAPDEKSGAAIRDAVQGAANVVSAAFARAVHGITSRLPTSEAGSNALGRLHAWAESILNGTKSEGSRGGAGNRRPPDERMTTKRENELKRLMNLLQNDPDQGLKYALPMNGENQGRGVAPPGGRLFENDPNFDPRRLNQPGCADVWDMPWEYRVRLIEMYRDLAQREQRLGRYRRAAYIYATLLNDLPAAAATLEAGHLFHDAAAVYIEHLKDPVKGAECLRRGGFWEEAVQIYRVRERWLDAAELYVEIGRPENAREMFQNEISVCRGRNDYVAAGEIADQRLNDPEQASTLLFTGWMQASNGGACFRKLMDLNGRRGNHRDAMWVMQQLTAEDELGQSQIESAAGVCSEFANTYPDEAVRIAARQHTLRLAATLLRSKGDAGHSASHSAALSAVRSLAQADRLLQSDTHRFELQRNLAVASEIKPAAPKRSSSLSPIKHVGNTNLSPEGTPKGTRWIDIACTGNEIFRCGVTATNRLVLVRQRLAILRGGRLVSEDHVIVFPNGAVPRHKYVSTAIKS